MECTVIHHFERARSVLAATMLGLFLFGNNYCVLAAFAFAGPGGAQPSCHASAAATPVEAAACCHPGAADDDAPAPASSTSPCCMLATAVAAPSAEPLVAADLGTALDANLVIVDDGVLAATAGRELAGHPPRPSSRLLGPPSGNRAPPSPRA
jgi:hypothetical protein